MSRIVAVALLFCCVSSSLGQLVWFGGRGGGGDAEMIPSDIPRQGGGPAGSYRPNRDNIDEIKPSETRGAHFVPAARRPASPETKTGDSRPAFFGSAGHFERPAVGPGDNMRGPAVGSTRQITPVVIERTRKQIPVLQSSAKRIPVVAHDNEGKVITRRIIPVIVRRRVNKPHVVVQRGGSDFPFVIQRGRRRRVPIIYQGNRERVPVFFHSKGEEFPVRRNKEAMPDVSRGTARKVPVVQGGPEKEGGSRTSHPNKASRPTPHPGPEDRSGNATKPLAGHRSAKNADTRKVSTEQSVERRKVEGSAVVRPSSVPGRPDQKPASHQKDVEDPETAEKHNLPVANTSETRDVRRARPSVARRKVRTVVIRRPVTVTRRGRRIPIYVSRGRARRFPIYVDAHGNRNPVSNVDRGSFPFPAVGWRDSGTGTVGHRSDRSRGAGRGRVYPIIVRAVRRRDGSTVPRGYYPTVGTAGQRSPATPGSSHGSSPGSSTGSSNGSSGGSSSGSSTGVDEGLVNKRPARGRGRHDGSSTARRTTGDVRKGVSRRAAGSRRTYSGTYPRSLAGVGTFDHRVSYVIHSASSTHFGHHDQDH